MNRRSVMLLAPLLTAVTLALMGAADRPAAETVSENKKTVQRYMDAFNELDHEAILACLTDDVEWVIPGAVNRKGKADFDAEIENDAFTGKPVIHVTRLTEENGVVVAEGNVRTTRNDGGVLALEFCDVFEMENGKIRKLTSYLMPIPD